MTEPTDDLRQAVSDALWCIEEKALADELADAVIRAYRSHPDGAAKDWCAGRDAAAETAESVEPKWATEFYSEQWSTGQDPAPLAPSQAIRALTPPAA